MTELTLPIMDADDARRLTERIRLTATNARESLTKLQGLVEEAQQGQAHIALGYKSWTAYLADVFGDTPMLLPRDERREVVQWLDAEGMTPPTIASVLGVTGMTVRRDLNSTEVTDVRSVEVTPSTNTPEEPTMSAPTLTGADGKQYPRLGAQSLTEKVRDVMADNEWHTLAELAATVGTNEATVSARIRDLRKVQFGNHVVPRRRTPSGSYEYRLDGDKSAPAPRSRQVATPTPAPRIGGNRKRHAAVIESMNVSLSGLAMAADQITELDNTVTAEKAAQLLGDLSTSIRSLNRLKQQLNTRKVTR